MEVPVVLREEHSLYIHICNYGLILLQKKSYKPPKASYIINYGLTQLLHM